MTRSPKARLLLACLAVPLVGVLGIVPAAAQEDSDPPSEEAGLDAEGGEQAGGQEVSGDGLVAKALAFVAAIQSGDAPRPPLRVEARQRFGNHTTVEVPPAVDLPNFEVVGTAIISSSGNAQYSMSLVPDLTSRVPTSEEQFVYDRMTDVRHGIVMGSTYYWSSSLLLAAGWPPESIPGWYAIDLELLKERSVMERFFSLLSNSGSYEELVTGIPGNDEYLHNLLSNTSSSSVLKKSEVRGHETTLLNLKIPGISIILSHKTQMRELLSTLQFMGYSIEPPDPLLIQLLLEPSTLLDLQIWIDDQGKVHRTSIDVSGLVARFVYNEQIPGFQKLRESFELTSTIDLIYLDDDPVIEPPPAGEIISTENILTHLLEIQAGFAEGIEEEAAKGDGAGGELADTGSNTPLLAIIGLGVITAGAMVAGLSRRLRTQSYG